MEALKDCKWEVEILAHFSGDTFFWTCKNDEFGVDDITGSTDYPGKKYAIMGWEEFAKLNGITNYEIVE